MKVWVSFGGFGLGLGLGWKMWGWISLRLSFRSDWVTKVSKVTIFLLAFPVIQNFGVLKNVAEAGYSRDRIIFRVDKDSLMDNSPLCEDPWPRWNNHLTCSPGVPLFI